MRIKSVRVRNFRSIEDEAIELQDYTCLVGANGSGKSNFMHALNIFFGESDIPGLNTRQLDEEDFHNKNVEEPIEITVTFADLSDEAKEELSHYVRHDQLTVSVEAKYDPDNSIAEVKQYGRRFVIKDFSVFFKAEKEGKRVADLREIYNEIKNNYPELPDAGTKDSMIESLRSFEEKNPEKCEEEKSDDEFYGISRGKNRLEKFIQWVYVPAVKDISSEQAEARSSALGKLLSRTVRSKVNFKDPIETILLEAQKNYKKLLDESQDQLREISKTLNDRLREWAHKDATLRLIWHQDPEKSIKVDEPFAQAILGEAGFEGELTRFGHGLQRSFLLAVLQELSGSNTDVGPRLILACEEPELYQHPPQARHLYNVLLTLSEQNSQVLVSTHSPYFVSGEGFESIRMVRKSNGKTSIKWTTHDQVSNRVAQAKEEKPLKATGQLAKIHQALQPELSELFFTYKLLLVEGLEDSAYLTTYLHLMGLWNEYRQLGCNIIPTQGKSEILQPLAIANCLEIPTFVIFDADNKPDKNGSRTKHRKDNLAILNLCEVEDPEAFPSSTFFGENVVMWDSDIGSVVKKDIGDEDWIKFSSEADKRYGHAGGMKKNVLHISSVLNFAWEANMKSASLKEACNNIMEFAKNNG